MVFHREYLKVALPSGHPLLLSRLFTDGILEGLAGKVLTGCRTNPQSQLSATGLPPHIMLANEIVNLETEFTKLKECLLSKLDTLPDELKTALLANFRVDGVLPLTVDQVNAMLQAMSANIIETINNNQAMLVAAAVTANNANGEAAETRHRNSSTYRTWTWGGRIHPVPQDFRFPR
jgi:hypothetical protein